MSEYLRYIILPTSKMDDLKESDLNQLFEMSEWLSSPQVDCFMTNYPGIKKSLEEEFRDAFRKKNEIVLSDLTNLGIESFNKFKLYKIMKAIINLPESLFNNILHGKINDEVRSAIPNNSICLPDKYEIFMVASNRWKIIDGCRIFHISKNRKGVEIAGPFIQLNPFYIMEYHVSDYNVLYELTIGNTLAQKLPVLLKGIKISPGKLTEPKVITLSTLLDYSNEDIVKSINFSGDRVLQDRMWALDDIMMGLKEARKRECDLFTWLG